LRRTAGPDGLERRVIRRLQDRTIGEKRALWAWGFLALPVVFFVTIRFYPTVEAFYASFTNWNIVGRMEYVGLANYARLVQDPAFWKVIGNTFAYLGLGVPISMLLSFVIAYYLDRVRFGHGLLRALYFIPHLTTAVAMAWVWRWFYQPPPIGAFNVWLTALGFSQMPFLRSTTQSLPAVLAPAIWAGIGFQIVIFLAGLKAIPRTYYEAAAIDGAGAWRVLFEITLPLLRPTIVFLVVTSSIAYLRIFDYVYAMTNGQGGPLDATKPLVLKIFETAFTHFEMGYAATQTIVLFVILLAISLLQLKLLRSR
jgi:multiple sugar transport system permease protein